MSSNWRSRIVGQGEVDPTTLETNPLNWRRHPLVQKRAIGGVLDEIGWVQQVIVNRQTGRLVDGPYSYRCTNHCIRYTAFTRTFGAPIGRRQSSRPQISPHVRYLGDQQRRPGA